MCNLCIRAGRQFGKQFRPAHFFSKEELNDLFRNVNARSGAMLDIYGEFNCIVNAKTTAESLDDIGPQTKYILTYHDSYGVCIGEGELTFTPTGVGARANDEPEEALAPDLKIGQTFKMELKA